MTKKAKKHLILLSLNFASPSGVTLTNLGTANKATYAYVFLILD